MGEYPEACPECGRIRLRNGGGWVPHTEQVHQATRRRLLRTFRELLDWETEMGFKARQAALCGFVTVAMRTTSAPWIWTRAEVPAELWDETDQEWLMQTLRTNSSEWAQICYDMDVLPEAWRCRVYDDVTR